MLKIIFVLLAFISAQTATANEIWQNSLAAEKNIFKYSSFVRKDTNEKAEYNCFVLKTKDNKFWKMNSIGFEINIGLEKDLLRFQEFYDVKIVFSNNKIFSQKIELKAGDSGRDRFMIHTSINSSTQKGLSKELALGGSVKIFISDNHGKTVVKNFSLKNSKRSIEETEAYCSRLYNSFKEE